MKIHRTKAKIFKLGFGTVGRVRYGSRVLRFGSPWYATDTLRFAKVESSLEVQYQFNLKGDDL